MELSTFHKNVVVFEYMFDVLRTVDHHRGWQSWYGNLIRIKGCPSLAGGEPFEKPMSGLKEPNPVPCQWKGTGGSSVCNTQSMLPVHGEKRTVNVSHAFEYRNIDLGGTKRRSRLKELQGQRTFCW